MPTQNYISGRSNLENCTYDDWLRKGTVGMNQDMILTDYILAWLDLFKKNTVKPASYDRLVTSFNALKPYKIAQMKIGDISFFDIQAYVNELTANGYSMTTIKKQLRIVTAPLKQAAALRIIFSDPSVGVKLPVPERVLKGDRNIDAFTQEEQKRLWQEIDISVKSPYKCIGLMLETGLRAGEVLALRWDDIDIFRRRLYVRATVINPSNKSKSSIQMSPKSRSSFRKIPLTHKAIDILSFLQMRATTDWVFELNGDRLCYARLVVYMKRLCQAADVRYRGLHVTRHTFATNCYYKGMDVKILSKLLGHSDVQVTYNTYIDLYGDAFDEMDKALNGG